jgi:hypothetical protein
MMKGICGIFILASFLSVIAWSDQPKSTGGATKSGDESKKTLDFDAEVVEGMNRQPLDSLTQTSEGDGSGSKNHLYRRIKNFNEESQELVRDQEETY